MSARVLAAILVLAVSVGLGNFAAAVSIGVQGTSARDRVRVAVVFGCFEAGMPILGLTIGRGLVGSFQESAPYVGAALLVVVGAWGLLKAWRDRQQPRSPERHVGTVRLLLVALALSMDNLAAGFALAGLHVTLIQAAAAFGSASAAMSLLGLELGRRIGRRIGVRSEQVGNMILVLVGIILAARLLS